MRRFQLEPLSLSLSLGLGLLFAGAGQAHAGQWRFNGGNCHISAIDSTSPMGDYSVNGIFNASTANPLIVVCPGSFPNGSSNGAQTVSGFSATVWDRNTTQDVSCTVRFFDSSYTQVGGVMSLNTSAGSSVSTSFNLTPVPGFSPVGNVTSWSLRCSVPAQQLGVGLSFISQYSATTTP